VPHALALSFNDPRGMCPKCEGLARVSKIDIDALVDKNKSLADGAILFPTFNVDGYHWAIFAHSGFFDVKKKLRDYTKAEWEKFLYLDDPKVKVKSIGNMKSPYEGLIVKFKRLFLGKDAEKMTGSLREHFKRIVTRGPCDACGGTRLGEAASACKIEKHSIADVSAMPISELLEWMKKIKAPSVAPLQARIVERLEHLVAIGLGYTPSRAHVWQPTDGEGRGIPCIDDEGAVTGGP
jgi:excinuclease UvrABC ATPase subunit